ncbi:ATP-binding protein [candidate division TA06 bacterium]|nr:ATP-binding protein [candidate division TA06 bacterium]
MNSIEVFKICQKLKPLIGTNAERLWHMYLAEDEYGRKDIALDIEILAEKLLRKEPLQTEPICLTPPSPSKAEGDILLGDIVYNDTKMDKLHIRKEDFIKQLGIFSITGEGKTNLATLLALQLLRQKIPFIVVDWKRTWRNILSLSDQYPELKELQVYTVGRDISPFFWNPFRAPPNIHYKSWINVVTEVLEKSHLAGMGVADFFIRIYEKLFRDFGFKEGHHGNMYPNFFDGVYELSKLKVYARELLWKQSAGRVFKSFTFGPSSKAFNARQPVKLEDLLEKPIILELDQEMSKPLRTFFTEMILRFIHLYRLGQGETDSLRHVLFLEEIHNLFPKTRIEQENSSSLEYVYREIRSFGQGLVSITQHPSLLPIYILGNCHTQIFLGLQHERDVRAARESLFIKPEEENYLDRLKVGEGIVKVKGRISPCLVKFPLVPMEKGIITDDSIRLRLGLSTLSQPEYRIKPVIRHFPEREDKQVGREILRFLEDILALPFSPLVQRYKRLSLSMRNGNDIKQKSFSEGFIIQRNIITKKTQLVLLELTGKAKAVLRQEGHIVTDTNEGVEHLFWKERIAEYYRKKGFNVEVEKQINGKPDITIKAENKLVAVEIETGNSDAVANIQKSLKANFSAIITVATNIEAKEKIMKQFREEGFDKDDRIKVVLAQEYDTAEI